MTHRIFNFYAGPATLPQEALEEAQGALLDYKGSGMGLMEISHRSKPYEEVHFGLMKAIKDLLGIGDEWDVILTQGGASLQFSAVPMNLLAGGTAAYVVTGEWAQRAAKEAKKFGTVKIAASTEAENFNRVPKNDEIQVEPGMKYVHFTSNNTIFGTQAHEEPPTAGAPLVADMSSDFLSRPVDMGKYSLIYAGAQKNLGPSGLTVIVLRKALLDTIPDGLPVVIDYRTHAKADSLYHTPPTWSIYISYLCCQWLQRQGGLVGIGERNERKAQLLYDALDNSDGFYRPTAEKASRSRMNVTFRLPSEELENKLVKAADARGLIGLKGHRSVGGLRASIYNAMPEAGVAALVELLAEFRKQA